MKKLTLIVVLMLGASIFINSTCKEQSSDSTITSRDPRDNGYVPDEVTAIKVAEAIWLPIYGDDIYNKRPFHAKLKNNSIWIIQGSLEPDELGGVPYAEIQKSDCRVLRVIHTK